MTVFRNERKPRTYERQILADERDSGWTGVCWAPLTAISAIVLASTAARGCAVPHTPK
jgi:hypothetical protein